MKRKMLLLTLLTLGGLIISPFIKKGPSLVSANNEVDKVSETIESVNPDQLITLPLDQYSSMYESQTRATTRLNWDLSANTAYTGNTQMSMSVGETIRFNLAYSPSGANIKVGILQPDNTALVVQPANGTMNYSFTVKQRGIHKIYIRNASNYTVSVTGYVYY